MTERTELYEWLEGQGAGGSLDSEGHFTLKHEEAWAKLTAFQFPIQEGWVLKLVQAMTVSSGTKLQVSQFANETVFTVPGALGWNREVVEDGIFGLDLRSSSEIGHVSMAVRILVQIANRPFSVNYCNGEKVIWTGQKFVALSASGPPVFQVRVGHMTFDERKQLLKMSSTNAARVSSNIVGALRQHCHLARDPIHVDGYLITSGENDQDFGTPAFARPLALLQVWDEHPLPTFETASTNRTPKADLGWKTASLDSRLAPGLRGSQSCYAVAMLSVFLKGNKTERLAARGSKILWLNDGVLVHREALNIAPRPVGLAVVISSEGLETDISGLTPRETQELKARRLAGLQAVYSHLQGVMGNRRRQGISVNPKLGGPSVLGVPGALLAIKAPVLAAPFLIGGAVGCVRALSGLGVMRRELNRALEELVGDFGSLVKRMESR